MFVQGVSSIDEAREMRSAGAYAVLLKHEALQGQSVQEGQRLSPQAILEGLRDALTGDRGMLYLMMRTTEVIWLQRKVALLEAAGCNCCAPLSGETFQVQELPPVVNILVFVLSNQ